VILKIELNGLSDPGRFMYPCGGARSGLHIVEPEVQLVELAAAAPALRDQSLLLQVWVEELACLRCLDLLLQHRLSVVYRTQQGILSRTLPVLRMA
jgi:hypothetical protein